MRKLLLLPIVLFAIISCETGEVGSSGTAHIYAVGNDLNLNGYITKDGITTSLGPGYFVQDVFVQGDDVYTSGDKDGVAAYTKNGVLTLLGTSTASHATNIFVDGDDVYVVGKKDEQPAYWKNGVVTLLDIDSGFKGWAYDITISNGTVYIAGYQHNFSPTNPITNILYWENGTRHTVYSPHVYSFGWLGEISIAVGGDDVYLAVNERDTSSPVFNSNAYLITNGLQEELIDDNSEVHDIFISGTDIYMCGDHITSEGVFNQSVVWKNGQVLVEKNSELGAFFSVVVVDGNVFAGGMKSWQLSDGTYRKDDTLLINNVVESTPVFGTPAGGTGYSSIFVTQ